MSKGEVRMYEFYKEQYEHIVATNKNLIDKKERALNIFTSISIVTVFPMLKMIKEMSIFGYQLTAYIIFTISLLCICIAIYWTVKLYVKKHYEIVIQDLEQFRKDVESYEQKVEVLFEQGNITNDKATKIIEKGKQTKIEMYYAKAYNQMLNNYNKKRKALDIYWIILAINICIEIVLAILIIIDIIFFK